MKKGIREHGRQFWHKAYNNVRVNSSLTELSRINIGSDFDRYPVTNRVLPEEKIKHKYTLLCDELLNLNDLKHYIFEKTTVDHDYRWYKQRYKRISKEVNL
jgi:hypothetical protein